MSSKSMANTRCPAAANAQEVTARSIRSTLIVGLGSFCGDDAVGWRVISRLQATLPDGATAVMLATPVELLDVMAPAQRLIICDACQGLGPPGSLHRLEWPSDWLGALRTATTHALGLAETLTLAASLSRLPADLVLWAVEIAKATATAPLSPAVEAALPRWAEAILAEAKQCTNAA